MGKKKSMVNAKFDDRIVFVRPRKKIKDQAQIVWQQAGGIWNKHPIFSKMNTKEIIEWLRGSDNDV